MSKSKIDSIITNLWWPAKMSILDEMIVDLGELRKSAFCRIAQSFQEVTTHNDDIHLP